MTSCARKFHQHYWVRGVEGVCVARSCGELQGRSLQSGSWILKIFYLILEMRWDFLEFPGLSLTEYCLYFIAPTSKPIKSNASEKKQGRALPSFPHRRPSVPTHCVQAWNPNVWQPLRFLFSFASRNITSCLILEMRWDFLEFPGLSLTEYCLYFIAPTSNPEKATRLRKSKEELYRLSHTDDLRFQHIAFKPETLMYGNFSVFFFRLHLVISPVVSFWRWDEIS